MHMRVVCSACWRDGVLRCFAGRTLPTRPYMDAIKLVIKNKLLISLVLVTHTIYLTKVFITLRTQQKTLAFPTCNGFGNQLLSLLAGMILAKETMRAVHIPSFNCDGTQTSLKDVKHNKALELLDRDFLKTFLYGEGIEIADPMDPLQLVRINKLSDLKGHSGKSHVLITFCLTFALSPATIIRYKHFIYNFLAQLKLRKDLNTYVKEVIRHMTQDTTRFNFLHLRIEDDWFAHCKRW